MTTLTHSAAAIRSSLSFAFRDEWSALTPADQILILMDCTEDGGVSDLGDYARCIGRGNLQAYAETQRVRFGRK